MRMLDLVLTAQEVWVVVAGFNYDDTGFVPREIWVCSTEEEAKTREAKIRMQESWRYVMVTKCRIDDKQGEYIG